MSPFSAAKDEMGGSQPLPSTGDKDKGGTHVGALPAPGPSTVWQPGVQSTPTLQSSLFLTHLPSFPRTGLGMDILPHKLLTLLSFSEPCAHCFSLPMGNGGLV